MIKQLFEPREFAPNPFYRSSPFAHRVPIATVRDNLYVLTDYSFAAAFRVNGMLYDLADTEHTVEFVESLRKLLNSLVPGLQLKVLHRVTHNYRHWLDEHQATLDGQQVFARYLAFDQAQALHRMMQQRRLLRSDNLIILTHKAKDNFWDGGSIKDKLTSLYGLTEKSAVVQTSLRRYRELIDNFERHIRPVVQQMEMCNLKPQRLNNSELYELAWETLNPVKALDRACPKIRMPDPKDQTAGMFGTGREQKALRKHPQFAVIAPLSEREQLCYTDWVIRDNYVYADGKYYTAITLRMLPTAVYPTMALNLAAIPFEATVSVDCLMLNKVKELDKQWKQARSAMSKADASLFGATPDPANKEKAQEQHERYMQMAGSGENPFRMRMTIVIGAKSPLELDQRVDSVLALLREMDDAVGMRDRFAVDTLIRSSWPFSTITDTHTRKALTSEISTLLPVFSRWEGSKRPVTLVLDQMNRLVRLDPFPINVPSKNRIICGATGTGKSFMAQLALVHPHAARENTEVLIVESGGSFELTTKCFGGVNIRLGPKSDVRINPFDLPSGFDDMSPERQEEELAVKYDFITKLALTMADLRDPNEVKVAENVLGVVVKRTYVVDREPQMRDFYRVLGEYTNPDDPPAEAIAKRLRTLLENYVVTETGEKGIYSPYFDCKTNFDAEAPIITLDLIDVKNTPALLIPMTMVTLMGLIYNRILSRDGKERLVIVDEAWALVKARKDGSQSPAGEAIELFWREGRKMGASSTMISQNIADMAADKTGRDIMGNSFIHYYLLHERIADNDKAFRSANFSKEKMDRVYNLRTEYGKYSEVMIKEDKGWGVVRLPSPGLRYWLATTAPEDLTVRRRYEKVYGEGYGLDLVTIVALLARDYPMGTHDPSRGKNTEMSEQEALRYADVFNGRLERFGQLIGAQKQAVAEGKQPELIPYDF